MATIVKNELDNLKNKVKYYSQLNTDNSTSINKTTTKLLSLYTTNNTKNLTTLTDEIMLQNKKIISNNNKYINILNRTISNYTEDSDTSKRKFEKIGE
jgi:hypothetical protein